MSSYKVVFYEKIELKNIFLYLCTRMGSFSPTYLMKRYTANRIYFFRTGVLTKLDSFHQWGMANTD